MKRIRIIFAVLAVLAFSVAGVFAQDIGANVSATVNANKSPDFSYGANGKADVWATFPIGLGSFTVQGNAQVQYNKATPTASPVSMDVDIFRLTFGSSNPQPDLAGTSFSLGRYRFAETTGYSFASTADGMTFSFLYPKTRLDFSAAYTGFLRLASSGVIMSIADETRAGVGTAMFGSPRFVSILEYSVPDLLGQSFTLSGTTQHDLNSLDKQVSLVKLGMKDFVSGVGGSVDTQYGTIKIAGPLFGNLYHSTFFTYGYGRELSYLADETSDTQNSYQYASKKSILAGEQLSLYMPSFLSSALTIRALYASGDKDNGQTTEGNTVGDATAFTPVTSTGLGVAFSPKLSNLIFSEVGFSVKPFTSMEFLTQAKAMVFLRSTEGPISLPGLKPGSTQKYLGSELDISANYRLFSDLGVSLNVGAFLPGVDPAGAFDTSYKDLQFGGSLVVTLNL
jgi:hypothetical protein